MLGVEALIVRVGRILIQQAVFGRVVSGRMLIATASYNKA